MNPIIQPHVDIMLKIQTKIQTVMMAMFHGFFKYIFLLLLTQTEMAMMITKQM